MSFATSIGKKKLLTIEFNPPKDANLASFAELKKYKGIIDGINVTDSPMAKPRMNSIIASSLIKDIGEPIFNLTCRDKNKIALTADLLGANALGLKNVLAITGDPDKNFDSVYKVNIFELIDLINSINANLNMDFFIGCASSIPNQSSFNPIKNRLKRKVEHGVRFVITQPIFSKIDLERFLELSQATAIYKLIGIMPILSYKSALYFNNFVKGINIPQTLLSKLENSSKEDSRSIGLDFLQTLLYDIKDLLPYINGLHIMKIDYEIVDLVKKFLEV